MMLGAGLACILLLMFPGEALTAALEAMELWARAFAPALFPFFVIMPALCCPEAAALYERALGRTMERLFGCPGRSAGPVAVGLMAGSPAGATALRRVKGGMSGAQATRTLLMCAGLSPAFLVASVGGAMLGDAGLGRILLRSQIGSVLISALVLRHAFGRREQVCATAAEVAAGEHPVRGAVLAVITVCGWMVCFSVLARLATMATPALRPWVLPFLEVTGGCWTIAGCTLTLEWKLAALGFFCGLGGLAVLMQNCAQIPEVKKAHLALGKLLQGALCGALAFLQAVLPAPQAPNRSTLDTCLTLACLLPVGVFVWSKVRRAKSARR